MIFTDVRLAKVALVESVGYHLIFLTTNLKMEREIRFLCCTAWSSLYLLTRLWGFFFFPSKLRFGSKIDKGLCFAQHGRLLKAKKFQRFAEVAFLHFTFNETFLSWFFPSPEANFSWRDSKRTQFVGCCQKNLNVKPKLSFLVSWHCGSVRVS